MMRIFLKIIYFLALLAIIAKLFFEPQFDAAVGKLNFFGNQQADTLTIGLAESLIKLDPLANDTGSRARLLHIYEPLVRLTKDLQFEPALAVAFGSLDDLTWEFRLRPGVKFHTGKSLTLADVFFSINEAKTSSVSGVRDIASTIQEVQKINDEIFHITTVNPDPLLLSKLSAILIFPEDASPNIGTGPYKLKAQEGGIIKLERFNDYWGPEPAFPNVALKSLTKKDEKISSLKEKTVDILANMPADLATNFFFPGYRLKTVPSLEINFLMFNFSRIFQFRGLREAVAHGIKVDLLSRLTQGFSVVADQFVTNGIFGYDPTIKKRQYDEKKAAELIAQAEQFGQVKTSLDLPKGLEVFGQNVKSQLEKHGMEVELNFLTPTELGKKITSGESEFFFFGWKNDLGDSGDFLDAVIHSKTGDFGQFNGANYNNSQVDQLIDLAQETIEPKKRLEYLRQAMNIITVQDIIGVPLFSPEVLYGVSEKLKWTPRVDGYVLAQEVKL